MEAQAAYSSPATLGSSVETLAGPGFCTETAVRDESSLAVGALAADASGDVYFETGPAGGGVVAKVGTDGRVTKLVTGAPAGPDASTPSAAAAARSPASSRLAPDGRGGILVATGPKIIRVDEGNAVITVAGDPAGAAGTAGAGSSGDGGPAAEARFTSARSLAADARSNLYVADEIDARAGTVRVRFVNRSDTAVTFYPGTSQELTVTPGEIDTIAGTAGGPGSGDGGPARGAVLQGAPLPWP